MIITPEFPFIILSYQIICSFLSFRKVTLKAFKNEKKGLCEHIGRETSYKVIGLVGIQIYKALCPGCT